MNLGNLRQQVLDNLGDDGATWAPSDTGREGGRWERLDLLINQAQQELGVIAERVDPTYNVKQADVPVSGESWTTGQLGPTGGTYPGEAYTPLPADFRRLLNTWQGSVGGGIAGEIQPMEIIPQHQAPFYVWQEGDSYSAPNVAWIRQGATSGSSSPRTYLHVVAGFNVNPTLSCVVQYAARLVDMADSTDECQLPVEYHHLIALGATVKALLQENGDAGNYKAMYDQAVQTIAVALPRRDGVGAPY